MSNKKKQVAVYVYSDETSTIVEEEYDESECQIVEINKTTPYKKAPRIVAESYDISFTSKNKHAKDNNVNRRASS